MPVNRNALIRYKTIDKCLVNPYRKWTLDDLIDACSDALYEFEGIDKGVSRRTVQGDIQIMRSDKLGYNAPIVVYENKYYKYEDPEYSITNMPLSSQDLDKLTEVMDILNQFKGFSHFQELTGMVQKLEDKVYTAKTKQRPIIHLDKNEQLQGLEFLNEIYQAILAKDVLEIEYQSFKARKANCMIINPYLLKEFKNRWFVVGNVGKKSDRLLTLALDRIKKITVRKDMEYIDDPKFDPDEYYKDIVGATVNEGMYPREVKIFIDKANAPYVITKPLHHSQRIIEANKDGTVVAINVIPNFELEKEILGFGENMKVLSPISLQKRIFRRLNEASNSYVAEENGK